MRTKTYESKTIPGASFVLREVTRVLRHQTEMKMVKQRHELRLIGNDYLAITTTPDGKDKPADTQTSEDKSQIAMLDIRSEDVTKAIRFEIVRALLDSFTLSGDYSDLKTADDLLQSGPEIFCMEIEDAAWSGWRVSEETRKNYVQPISSAPAEDGLTINGTAITANSETNTLFVAVG